MKTCLSRILLICRFLNTCQPRALILLLLSIMSIFFFFLHFETFSVWVFTLEQNLRKVSENILVEIILFYSYLTNSLATCNIVGSKNIFLWTFRGTDLYLFEHTYLLMISVLPHGLLSLSSSLSQSVSFSPR